MSSKTRRSIPRRATLPFLLAAIFFTASIAYGQGTTKSRVVTVNSPRVINDRNLVDPAEVRALLAAGLEALTGEKDTRNAWRALGLEPKDVVGVKVNCNNWTVALSPPAELIAALAESLGTVIPTNNIIVYEASVADMESAGFKRNRTASGVRFMACNEGDGFDEEERLSRIATDTCTKLINLASLKCVEQGMGASLFFKNHIGSLVEKDMPKCHGNMDFLAAVLAKPSLKNKTILNLCHGLRGTYRVGVPWYWGGLILGRDPVATEYVAYEVINEKRNKENIAPLALPAYLKIAESKYGLGTCTPGHIDWVRAK